MRRDTLNLRVFSSILAIFGAVMARPEAKHQFGVNLTKTMQALLDLIHQKWPETSDEMRIRLIAAGLKAIRLLSGDTTYASRLVRESIGFY